MAKTEKKNNSYDNNRIETVFNLKAIVRNSVFKTIELNIRGYWLLRPKISNHYVTVIK